MDAIDLEEQLREREATVSDLRISGTVHQRPIDRFLIDQPHLMQITGHRPFGARLEGARVVADDYLVSFDTNRYSVPFTLIGKTVEVVVESQELVIRHRQREVARHPLLSGKHQMLILPEHGPGAIARNAQRREAPRQARLLNRWLGPPEVEVRDLHLYEEAVS